MRRSLVLSGGLHLLVLMALLLGVAPKKRFAEPVEQGIPVELMIAMGPTAPAATPTAPSEPAPQPTPEQMTKLRQELSRQLQGDAISAYVSALQSRLGFSVNQTVYRRAMGIETQQP